MCNRLVSWLVLSKHPSHFSLVTPACACIPLSRPVVSVALMLGELSKYLVSRFQQTPIWYITTFVLPLPVRCTYFFKRISLRDCECLTLLCNQTNSRHSLGFYLSPHLVSSFQSIPTLQPDYTIPSSYFSPSFRLFPPPYYAQPNNFFIFHTLPYTSINNGLQNRSPNSG